MIKLPVLAPAVRRLPAYGGHFLFSQNFSKKKKNLSKKNFDEKKNLSKKKFVEKKNLSKKKFVEKKIVEKKKLSKKKLSKKNFVEKNFCGSSEMVYRDSKLVTQHQMVTLIKL